MYVFILEHLLRNATTKVLSMRLVWLILKVAEPTDLKVEVRRGERKRGAGSEQSASQPGFAERVTEKNSSYP
jgi:hypothetical protein